MRYAPQRVWSLVRVLHPRGCGERVSDTGRAATAVGSSPQARGTVLASEAALFVARCQWQPKTAHFWQLKMSHLFGVGGRCVGGPEWRGRAPVSAVGSGATGGRHRTQAGVMWLLAPARFVAAHNAKFDRRVLNACCARYRLRPPRRRFVCTVELAHRQWPFASARLPDVCRRLGIPLRHHDAGSDALACARVVLAAGAEGWRPR